MKEAAMKVPYNGPLSHIYKYMILRNVKTGPGCCASRLSVTYLIK